MDKKKKIIIAIICLVAVVIIVAIGMVISGNKGGSSNEGNTTQPETTQYTWPNLTEYDIPNFEKGSITELVDECNKNEDKLNYFITVKDIKKSDIVDYSKKFDSNWNVFENDNTILIISANSTKKYSIFIEVNEDDKTAKFTISSMN